MSTGNPPKGSADWLDEQGGDDMTPPAKGTMAMAEQPTPSEPAPKGTLEWTEQNSGENAPEPTENKPTPRTDVAPAADKHVGVSPQNNTDAVMGYDQQIAALQAAANQSKPETEEDRKKRERKERSQKIWAAVGDGLMSLSNLYFTSRGAPNMYDHKTMSQQTPLQAQLDKLKAEREANADKYLQYSLRIGDLQNDRAKTLREMEAEQEKRKLAREKAEREAEAHGWLRELQPDKLREQAGKATTAEEKAKTAAEEAKNAPELYKAKVVTEQNRGRAAAASATNSYASARAHDRSNNNEFSAWDENGREHKFSTAAAAETYARQHGTLDYGETEEVSGTETDVTDRRGRIVKGNDGKPVRKNATTVTTRREYYPKRVTPDNTPPSRRKSKDNRPPSRR